MPRPFAASITVAPLRTSVSLPSMVTFGISGGLSLAKRRRGRIPRLGHHAALVIDVVLELAAEMLDEALHRQGGGVAERADGAPGDVVGDVDQQVEVLVLSLAVLDAVDHAVEPAGSLAAGRALATGLLEVEIRQALERLDHAGGLVHHDHGARAEHR